jgi:TatD DNase family protein
MTTEIRLVDTHAHLSDERLASDLDAVLAASREAGVSQILAIGTTADDSEATLEIATRHPGVFAAVGIQPNHVAEAGPDDWTRVVALSRRPRVVAIGETGLDRYWDRTPFDAQQVAFDRHLGLAAELGLPVVIHCRNCERDIVEQLGRQGRPVSGVLHSFTGTWDDAQAFLGLGLHISFAGMVTFGSKSLDPLRDAATRIPLDRLLVETDSPYLSPHPFRGKPNSPGRVSLTAGFLARLRGLDSGELAAITTSNARRLFRLPDDDCLA